MKFDSLYQGSELMLTEGAIVERLRHEFMVPMDPYINHAGLIYDDRGMLALLYRQYIETAIKFRLPLMLMTPTRRVHAESHKRSDYKDQDLISDAVNYLDEIRQDYNDHAHKIAIGGLLGCKGDAYDPADALSTDESFDYHKEQVENFSRTGVDFLFAGIMPDVHEASGMAKAMATSGLPYIISFMISNNGCLLDGTSISAAIRIIDGATSPQPLCYISNCVHPRNLILALSQEINKDTYTRSRFKGVQANASVLSPAELDQCATLDKDNFENIVEEMIILHTNFGLKIFGGCCGTDHIFMEKLCSSLTRKKLK